MKTKFLFCITLVFLSLLQNASAQPTFTSAIMGEIGDVFEYAVITGDFDPGDPGADVTWDFSDLVPGGTTAGYSYVAVASTPYASDFPGANIAASAGAGNYNFNNLSATEYTNYGVANPTTVIYYDDPEELFVFPLTYGSLNSDALHADFTSGVVFERSGTTTMNADSWGTLILPSGTYTDVLRVKVQQDYSDVPDGIPFPYEYNFDLYYWFVAGSIGPILEYFHQEITLAGSTTTTDNVYLNAALPSLLETHAVQEANVFPNPASDNITVQLPENAFIDEIAIYDITGKKAAEYRVHTNSGSVIDISSLTAGMYIVKVKSGTSLFAQNIIVN